MKNKTAQEKELRIASEIAVNVARLIYEKAKKKQMMADFNFTDGKKDYAVMMSDLQEICLSQEPEEAPIGESAAYWKAKFDEVHNILFPEDDATVTEVINTVKRLDDDIDKYHKQATEYHDMYENAKSEKEQLEYKYEHHEKGELAVKLQRAEKNNEIQESVIENLQERLSKYESSIMLSSEAKQEPPVQDKGIEERAEAYSAKYNDHTTRDYDNYDIEAPKYSCDGCDQNIEALREAYKAGALSERKVQEVSASQLAAAFHAGQNSVGYRDECMSRIDMTFENYLKSQATRGGK